MLRQRALLLGLSIFAGAGLLLPLAFTGAQEPLPAFATNTPAAAPRAALPAEAPRAPMERFALRLWQAQGLVEVFVAQVRELPPGDGEALQAARLTQHELGRRFPAVPDNPRQREQLLRTLLNAPRGSLDLRPYVRPFIASQLRETEGALNHVGSVMLGGFSVQIAPFDLDGAGELDFMLHTVFPPEATDSSAVVYEDFVLAQRSGQGGITFPEVSSPFPAAPSPQTGRIVVERIGDLTRNGLEELALSFERPGAINRELRIYGLRDGRVVDLIVPGAVAEVGGTTRWPLEGGAFTATVLRLESPAWGCMAEQTVNWEWRMNFFRQSEAPGDFRVQDTLACRLHAAEPLFARPLDEAISTLSDLLDAALVDEAGTERGAMVLAMLQLLNGQADLALARAAELQGSAPPGSWLDGQAAAFSAAASRPDVTPVEVCALVEAANEHGACDLDALLTYLFEQQPVRRDLPVTAQLQQMGIPIAETRVISEVGRFDREAVRLDVPGDRWWAFAPLDAEVYRAERIDPPPGTVGVDARPAQVDPPRTAFDALLIDDDPAAALTILANHLRDNPGASLTPAGRYLRALSQDLSADRVDARRGYFELWRDHPETIWGRLAAVHLEQR